MNQKSWKDSLKKFYKAFVSAQKRLMKLCLNSGDLAKKLRCFCFCILFFFSPEFLWKKSHPAFWTWEQWTLNLRKGEGEFVFLSKKGKKKKNDHPKSIVKNKCDDAAKRFSSAQGLW